MNPSQPNSSIQVALKRAFDLVFSILILAISAPVIGLLALLIRLDSPGKAFFRHRRVGKDGRPFDLFKLRSMLTGGDDTGYQQYLRDLIESERNGASRGLPYVKMDGDQRVTRIGKRIRRFYLDELPQFYNVIKGEMSVVGPRPHVQFEVDNYLPEQRRRLSVKPGMTGLWQVEGKADCTFNELIELDLEYIDHWSLWLDLQIIGKTALRMLKGGEKFWSQKDKRVPEKAPAQPPVSNPENCERVLTPEIYVSIPETSESVLTQ